MKLTAGYSSIMSGIMPSQNPEHPIVSLVAFAWCPHATLEGKKRCLARPNEVVDGDFE